MSDSESHGCGCGSIILLIIAVIMIWGLLFGFTYNGHTYNINCSCDQGVELDTRPTKRAVAPTLPTTLADEVDAEAE